MFEHRYIWSVLSMGAFDRRHVTVCKVESCGKGVEVLHDQD